MFKAEPGLIIWTIISFFLLLGLLWKVAYPQILKGMKKREETIKQQLEEAQKTKKEAENLLEDYKRQLAEARSEAQKIINKSLNTEDNRRLVEEYVSKVGDLYGK